MIFSLKNIVILIFKKFKRTLDYALYIGGNSNIIRSNLVAMNYWGSTFVPWEAQYAFISIYNLKFIISIWINFLFSINRYDLTYWGAIDAHAADSIVMEGNFVSGAQRSGILFRGGLCPGVASIGGGMNHSVKNNHYVIWEGRCSNN